jgi:hypothetical protein
MNNGKSSGVWDSKECLDSLLRCVNSGLNDESLYVIEMVGAEGGSRTRTSLRTTDFKSAASAIPPPRHARQNSMLAVEPTNRLGQHKVPGWV